MSETKLSRFQTLELIFGGIVFSLVNNIATIWNAKTLLENQHQVAGGLTIFFLFFPGLVTSVGFLALYCLGNRRFGKLSPVHVVIAFLSLLSCYPIVPIVLCFYTLMTGKSRDLAILSKLLGGFLDDGPQFVLRLIIVVLFGIGSEKSSDIVFILSMVTSFGGLVYFGLQFNERETSALTKWLLAFPMFAALLAARGFTLAVFLKETLDNKEDKKDKSEWIGALIVLTFYLAANIAIFKLSQQDIVRSFLFGLSSTLIPAGYNNDKIFYQCPSQPFSDSVSTYTANPEPASISPQTFQIETSNNTTNKMRSGLFLILHCIVNTAMLSTCAIYISVTRDLSVESDNALVLSQMLAVIPGCFFTLARSILLLEKERPNFCHRYAWKLTRIIFAFIFGIIAYGSLIPALFWSLIWKVVVAATTDDEEDDD